tara:strand:- start:1074 stop:1208 length:135 start_codon:yes stop_codon:yes gene_type:complete
MLEVLVTEVVFTEAVPLTPVTETLSGILAIIEPTEAVANPEEVF